jgi:hypothetical protein
MRERTLSQVHAGIENISRRNGKHFKRNYPAGCCEQAKQRKNFMTDCNVHECRDCGAHWPEDVMRKGEDGNWYCPECWYPEPEPDLVDFEASREDR